MVQRGKEFELPQADDVRIGDTGPVIRAAGNGVEIVMMKFGWPPPRPKAGPVFNFKSDNRHFERSRRCLILMSGFFEFTGAKYPKAKHRFTLRDSPVMAIAGLWSEADFHNRTQVFLSQTDVILPRQEPAGHRAPPEEGA